MHSMQFPLSFLCGGVWNFSTELIIFHKPCRKLYGLFAAHKELPNIHSGEKVSSNNFAPGYVDFGSLSQFADGINLKGRQKLNYNTSLSEIFNEI